ncbi:hypothetical protein [Ahrensia sp. R2A130]|uniref:hypothetical protein n=1 Tax=Ahrensia sp. R2A130 TaxID=744979 RepID=UPI000590AA51|nr:hypothetical protein [Ahrensia sp. R2A130]
MNDNGIDARKPAARLAEYYWAMSSVFEDARLSFVPDEEKWEQRLRDIPHEYCSNCDRFIVSGDAYYPHPVGMLSAEISCEKCPPTVDEFLENFKYFLAPDHLPFTRETAVSHAASMGCTNGEQKISAWFCLA